jgi:hypothetical protein
MPFGNLYSELFSNWKVLNFLLEFFLKKGQSFVYVRLGASFRDEILHEHALLG